MGTHLRATGHHDEDDEPGDRDPDDNESPETPLDEPRPPRVDDPPPQPDPKGPYVVQAKRDFLTTEAQR